MIDDDEDNAGVDVSRGELPLSDGWCWMMDDNDDDNDDNDNGDNNNDVDVGVSRGELPHSDGCGR